jgi:hypothetical protein
MGHVSPNYFRHRINNLILKPDLQGLDKISMIKKSAIERARLQPRRKLKKSCHSEAGDKPGESLP